MCYTSYFQTWTWSYGMGLLGTLFPLSISVQQVALMIQINNNQIYYYHRKLSCMDKVVHQLADYVCLCWFSASFLRVFHIWWIFMNIYGFLWFGSHCSPQIKTHAYMTDDNLQLSTDPRKITNKINRLVDLVCPRTAKLLHRFSPTIFNRVWIQACFLWEIPSKDWGG